MENFFKNFFESRKVKHQQMMDMEENSAFNIVEKNGVIYIKAGHRAVQTINSTDTAEEIIDKLNNCRKSQLQFKKDS